MQLAHVGAQKRVHVRSDDNFAKYDALTLALTSASSQAAMQAALQQAFPAALLLVARTMPQNPGARAARSFISACT